MRDLNQLIEEILPTADYQHRNGFSNDHIIDGLSKQEKELVEGELLKRLHNSNDLLVAETLGYLGSTRAIVPLERKLKGTKSPGDRISLASIIYQLDKRKNEMVDIALADFAKIKDKYRLISAFYYLATFQDNSINAKIREYHEHPDYLVSYNAKRFVQ